MSLLPIKPIKSKVHHVEVDDGTTKSVDSIVIYIPRQGHYRITFIALVCPPTPKGTISQYFEGDLCVEAHKGYDTVGEPVWAEVEDPLVVLKACTLVNYLLARGILGPIMPE